MTNPRHHEVYKVVPILPEEKETRFVRIHPGSTGDDLQAELFSKSLNQFDDFFALSYTWGSSTKSQVAIRLNGINFAITDNLWTGLTKLRSRFCKSEPVTVWIDAISINQDDTEEKNYQVPMMKDIYSSAGRVVIWLGDGDATLDRTMEFLEQIPQQVDDLPAVFGDLDDLSILSKVAGLEAEKMVAGFLDLCNRPWFRRTWILQEVALPIATPLVLCGNSLICWDCFIDALGYLRYFFIEDSGAQKLPNSIKDLTRGLGGLDPRTPNVTYHIREYYHYWKSILGGVPFMALLEDTSLCLSSNPRDKIYGFLALADNESRKLTKVDYNKPTNEVYTEAFELSVLGLEGLQTLSKAGLQFHSNSATAWPSWLPNFDRCGEPSILKLFSTEQLERGAIYNASLGLPPIFKRDGDKLTLFGLFVDEVQSVAAAYSQHTTSATSDAQAEFTPHRQTSSWVKLEVEQALNLFLDAAQPSEECVADGGACGAGDGCLRCIYAPDVAVRQSAHQVEAVIDKFNADEKTWGWEFRPAADAGRSCPPSVSYDLFEPFLEAMSRVFIADHFALLPWMREGVPAPDSSLDTILKFLSRETSREFPVDEDHTPEDEKIVENAIVCALSGRSALATRNGWIGIGPINTAPGDVICVIAGADVPFVLRPTAGSFRLVGECFVQGLMFGELLEDDPFFTESENELRLEGFSIV
ncbi:heterokaryon incompatibility protein-domain-containing protein [Dactylonectria estremocensis]|uniref:Heterokaryon incompatibility protein-domain-containing protein n=1 Tax=Dactylonectria estremocensis TaxID=1079267 RepID=A0A9P9IQY9_9HYPO|nr:heterokaryon incompatibility protein-domain-containing protein [Dactylonectria estremocensis]